jgi:hypothetical protein
VLYKTEILYNVNNSNNVYNSNNVNNSNNSPPDDPINVYQQDPSKFKPILPDPITVTIPPYTIPRPNPSASYSRGYHDGFRDGYNDFYKDNIFTVNINILYINKDNNIEKVSEEIFFMRTPNIISREEILGIIKKNSVINDNNYSLLSIIKCNITLNPEDINIFLKTNNLDYYNERFFTTLKHIDTIVFEKTVITFQDLNTLFIIFYEKDKDKIIMNNTKKVYLRVSNPKKKTIRR